MVKDNVFELDRREEIVDPLNDLLREGAQQLLQRAIEVKVQDLLGAYSNSRTADRRAAVVRSGYLPDWAIQTG